MSTALEHCSLEDFENRACLAEKKVEELMKRIEQLENKELYEVVGNF